jgi:hypothetical protein
MENKEFDLYENNGFSCPICGKRILTSDEEGNIYNYNTGKLLERNLCPHLAYIIHWGGSTYGTSFVLTGDDYARRLVSRIKENDPAFVEEMLDLKCNISDEDIERFLSGDFITEDDISGFFANLPTIEIENLLKSNAIFYSYSHGIGYSGLTIAIEPDDLKS